MLFTCHSAGDLLSNGEELGDPCCLWVKDENTVLDFAETSQLSHPGYAESALTAEQREVLATYDCSALAQEQKGDHRDMFYLAGEERMNVTLRFSANIPVRETSYLRYTYNLPAQPAVNYLVGFESIIE